MSSPSEPTEPRDYYSESDTQMLSAPEWERPRRAHADESPYRDPTRTVIGAEETDSDSELRSDEPTAHREPGRGSARHLVALLLGFALTPVGIGLLAYGGYRYQLVYTDRFVHDDRGLMAFGAGGFVLLLVAVTAALSPVGPMVGGLVYGLLPAGLFLVIPDDTIGWVADAPLFPDATDPGTVLWMGSAVCLVVGATLVGTALATAVRRR